jgi:hypothetical protein
MLNKLKVWLKKKLRYDGWVEEPEWTGEDEERFRSFLVTPTGKKLKRYLLNMTLRHNAAAVREKKDLAYHCGWASGFNSAVGTLELLANPQPKHEAESDMDDSSELERYRP